MKEQTFCVGLSHLLSGNSLEQPQEATVGTKAPSPCTDQKELDLDEPGVSGKRGGEGSPVLVMQAGLSPGWAGWTPRGAQAQRLSWIAPRWPRILEPGRILAVSQIAAPARRSDPASASTPTARLDFC